MELIYKVKEQQPLLAKSISLHGSTAEHNLFHYFSQEGPHKQNVFFHYEDHKGVLARKHRNDLWYTFADVLAPEHERLAVFDAFLQRVFSQEKAKKVVVEMPLTFYRQIKQQLHNKYQLCRLNYYLHWPVFSMQQWDSALSGKPYKKLRNIWNGFMKKHAVEIVDSVTVAKPALKQIVYDWKKKREASDFAYHNAFLNLIEDGFKGIDHARTLIVDDKPCTITAGWKIPNTTDYYSAIGVLNYAHPGLGEIANILDLNELQERGYTHVDFGGSDLALLRFKSKFKPSYVYDTHIFSIKKKG